jgi:acetate CoA/acetoacetate CoA-transferase alpha subunit
MNKIITKDQVKDLLFDGMSILVGGFMTNGTAETICDAIVESGVKDLTLICNDGGFEDKGIGKIIKNNQCKTLITSHVGLNPLVGQKMASNEIEVILTPQGTLAEQIRAGGSGLGGVLTPTGLGTLVAEGKEIVTVDGKDYLLEKAIKGDLAICASNQSDKFGNSTLLGTTINFNPIMALAGEKVIVETQELVDQIDPNRVNIPGVVVDYVLVGGSE